MLAPGGPEGDTVTVAEKLLNTEYCTLATRVYLSLSPPFALPQYTPCASTVPPSVSSCPGAPGSWPCVECCPCLPSTHRTLDASSPRVIYGVGCPSTPPSPSSSSPAGIDSSASWQHSLHWLLMRWCWQMPATPHSLHRLLMRWCWQMPAPPHSLHVLLMRWCWQMPAPPHSLQSLLRRWCWQMLAPPHSLHVLLWRWCGQRPPLRVAPSAVAPAAAPMRRARLAALPPVCVCRAPLAWPRRESRRSLRRSPPPREFPFCRRSLRRSPPRRRFFFFDFETLSTAGEFQPSKFVYEPTRRTNTDTETGAVERPSSGRCGRAPLEWWHAPL